MAKPIGNIGISDLIGVGDSQFVDITNLKVLSAFGTASLPNSTCRSLGVGAGYQVPGGKTFRIIGFGYFTDDTLCPSLGYSNNDVGQQTASSFSSYVDAMNGGGTPLQLVYFQTTTTNTIRSIPLKLDVPTGKYVAVSVPGGTGSYTAFVYGYEV